MAMATNVFQGIGLLKNANGEITGAVNETGQFVFNDRKYQDIEYAREGRYKIRENGLWGYIDSIHYQKIIPPGFYMPNAL